MQPATEEEKQRRLKLFRRSNMIRTTELKIPNNKLELTPSEIAAKAQRLREHRIEVGNRIFQIRQYANANPTCNGFGARIEVAMLETAKQLAESKISYQEVERFEKPIFNDADILSERLTAAWRYCAETTPEKLPQENCVYLIKGGGFCKIGVSSNVGSRLSELQIGSPLPLALKTVIPCHKGQSYRLEKALQREFKEKRTHGEWFALDQNDLANIKKSCAHWLVDYEKNENAPSPKALQTVTQPNTN